MIPSWLHVLSITSLALGAICAALIGVDVARRPQHMWIMNVVWPLTALFGSVAVLWLYFAYGRAAAHEAMRDGMDMSMPKAPFPILVANGALHCGSGCTLGDIIAETLAFLVPAVAVWFGYGTIFSDKMFAVWVLDYVLAYAFGIVFQYFTIAPMRNLGLRAGIWAAVKADTLSLTSWQVGMYGFMAIAQFYLFGTLLGTRLEANTTEFWFVMQIAMICGFVTSYPVNWWLIRIGLKEKM